MNKLTKKIPNYNQDAIHVLQTKYGFSNYYIRQSINGNKKGLMPDALRSEYKQICTELEKAKSEAVKNFTNL